MPWLLLGVLVLVLLLALLRVFINANPKTLARSLRQAAAILLGAGAAYFLFTGRFGPAMLLGTGSLMALGRWPGGIPGFGDFGAAPAAGNSSEVETQWLKMQLDHDTGEIDGQVLQGAFKGSRLQELSFEQLLELLADCRVADNQSAALLETYLDRAHGEDWRERSAGGRRSGPAPTGKMTAAEAREILGVGPEASPDEIRDAHRRLMKKVHPDQGGSTYLASKINEAKDLLLGV